MDLELDDLWHAKYGTLVNFLFLLMWTKYGGHKAVEELRDEIEKNPHMLKYSFVRILANATDFNKALDVAWDDIEEALRDA